MIKVPEAVFLLKSPLQYLNALEAAAAFGLNPDETWWIFLADSKSRQQLFALAISDQTDGKAVTFLTDLPLFPSNISQCRPIEKSSNFLFSNALFSIYKLSRLAEKCSKIPLVFIGDLANPLMCHFVNRVQPQQTVHLDDGVATLDYAAQRAGKEQERVLRRSKQLKLALKRKILGLCDETIPAVTFFTLYQNLKVGPQDQVIEHNFSNLRKNISTLPQGEKIFFLGGPLVEAGFLGQDRYLDLLRGVADYYENKQVVYVAHRREDQKRLTLIRQKTGWQTQLFDYPIEYQLARVGPRPCLLASFFSSGLETCQQIFGSQLTTCAFALPSAVLDEMPSAKRQILGEVYGRLQQLMPVIDLAEQQS